MAGKSTFVIFFVLTGLIVRGATYTVTTAGNGATNDGTSLRWAITQVNGGSAGDRIEFNIGGAAPHTITITSALPTISKDDITIDGSTQPLNGGSGDPKIIIDGGSSVGTGIQLSSTKDRLILYGLHIKGFTDYGVRAEGSILTIGGTASGKRVVVSGCGSAATEAAIWAQEPTIVNTFIGTDSTGNTAAGNTGYGIKVESSGLLTIGTSSVYSRCVISNNSNHGIFMTNADNSVIKNCYIGISYSGTSDFGNGGCGIYAGTSTNPVTIGGSVSGEGNVISGNTSHGIYVDDADGWVIYGNYIGTNAAGTSAIANGGSGIYLDGTSTAPVVGGCSAGQGNLISGNSSHGIMGNSDLDDAIIRGNKIGTDVNGTQNVGNGGYGIYIYDGTCTNNIIGGAGSCKNIIAYNGDAGIAIDANSGITVDGNKITRNSIFCNENSGSQLGIDLIANGNDGKATPVITSANGSTVSGTSGANDSIEVYLDDFSCGCQGKNYVASTKANGSGSWTLNCANCFNGDVTAIATDASNNTSEFSGCQPTGVLPIELLVFSARLAGNRVHLYWSTAEEINNDFFTIERTTNGKMFEEIAVVPGAGNSHSVKYYETTDDAPLSGISYYRLKQTDYDGKYQYSQLVAISRNQTTEVKIFPNPAPSGNLNVFIAHSEEMVSQLTIYNQVGEAVHTETLEPGNAGVLKKITTVTPLSSGVYFVEVVSGSEVQRHKLVVK